MAGIGTFYFIVQDPGKKSNCFTFIFECINAKFIHISVKAMTLPLGIKGITNCGLIKYITLTAKFELFFVLVKFETRFGTDCYKKKKQPLTTSGTCHELCRQNETVLKLKNRVNQF